ncbi:chaplin family protein [Kitasatospora sp. NPDC050543]|uniref:chaplin n=1 Tax=Kitasatospora sp. NPDC050543 TaxID=3364054 RepID=UPI0037B478B1
MRNVAKKGLLTAMATGSVLASTAGYAYASAEAHGGAANSPGAGSGNSVQVPVDIPVNACGNTVDIGGSLNPAFGNTCANADGGGSGDPAQGSDEARSQGGATASGETVGSPGTASGNSVKAPVHIPVNACGNSAVIGGHPAFGHSCANAGPAVVTPPAPSKDDCPPETQTPPAKEHPVTPGVPRTGIPPETVPVTAPVPASVPQTAPSAAPQPVGSAPVVKSAPAEQPTATQLASTGSGGVEMLGAAGLATLLGGGVLYRRARAGAR